MDISRVWAMPNKFTFSIPPIYDIIRKYANGIIIDPFAANNSIATHTNDIDPNTKAQHHMDALEFLRTFHECSVDTVLYDPPYSPRQVAESYKKLKMSVNMQTTQASYWSRQKDVISNILRPDGIVISCGWNSNGMGLKRGFKILEILMVAHGGNHNDTIVVVEQKLNENKQLF